MSIRAGFLLWLLKDEVGPLIMQPSNAVFTGGEIVVCFVRLVRTCSKLLRNWAFKQERCFLDNSEWIDAREESEHRWLNEEIRRLLDISEWIDAKEESEHRRLKEEIRRDLYRVSENDVSFTTWYCVLRSGLPSAFAVMDYGTLYIELSSALLQNTHLRRLVLEGLVIPLREENLTNFGRTIGLSSVNSLTIRHPMTQGENVGEDNHILSQSSCFSLFLNEILSASKNLSLRTLALQKTHLGGTRNMALFARGICDHQTLQSLSLEDFYMDSSTLQILLGDRGLENNNRITHLKLDRCGIGNTGVEIFLQHWRRDSPLQRLSLSRNNIEALSAQALLRAARHHPALTELDLSYNRSIGYEGLKRIGDELESQPYLRSLDLLRCVDVAGESSSARFEFAKSSAEASLLKGLTLNCHLHNLILMGNGLQGFATNEIEFFMGRNRFLSRNEDIDDFNRMHELMVIITMCQQRLRSPHLAASFIFVLLQEFPHAMEW